MNCSGVVANENISMYYLKADDLCSLEWCDMDIERIYIYTYR